MGALSVPPLEWYPLGTVRPTRVMAKTTTKKETRSRHEEIPSNQLLDAGPGPNHSKKIFYKASLTLLRGPVLSLLLGLKV